MNNTRLLMLEAARAAQKSPDPSTQNGAVLTTRHGPITDIPHPKPYISHCNTFPEGVRITEERLERPLKYNYIEHAERNVILQAAREGVPTAGATMYVLWAACSDCARAIIQAGIRKIVVSQKMMDGTPAHWKDSIKHAFVMFEEADIEVEYFDGFLGETILFNGQPFTL